MNDLMTLLRLPSFEAVLSAYEKAGGGKLDFDAIDGGAGSGSTARKMRQYLTESSQVYAYEPFPGNHRFFEMDVQRVVLIKKALADCAKSATFNVSSVVSQDSDWGKKGYAGYSSVGHIAVRSSPSDTDLVVDCVAAGEDLPEGSKIGFVKLDLQGGELDALKGMKRFFSDIRFMWVEFTNQPGLYEFLSRHNFTMFDTEYFMIGDRTESAMEVFDVSRENVTLSTGKQAWFGFRKHSWLNYDDEFIKAKREHEMVQTDLVCVNNRFLREFVGALRYI